MSQAPSPIPHGAASGAGAAAESSEDWRASVQQSYRNTEVREIAKVLAALEPGATSSSKLRLAMQFEDTVFKQATSLSDYRKRLTKRLKKVQKSYVPATSPEANHNNKLRKLNELKRTYGDTLLYIIKHADTAIQQMRVKQGADKASQLKQHTDSVISWAKDLGLLPSSSSSSDNNNTSTNTDGTTTPNLQMSDAELDKLHALLERRTENIRSHVVKLADPDRFLLETMEKTERDINDRASHVLATHCHKRYEQLSRSNNVDGNMMIQNAWEVVQRAIPLPTRSTSGSTSSNQRNSTDNDTRVALIHLEKMRASSSLLLGWTLVADKSTLPLHNRNNILPKAHSTVQDGIEFVTNVMTQLRQRQGEQTKSVTLEDAWMKPLSIPTPTLDSLDTTSSTSKSTTIKSNRPVIRTRMLLQPGRNPPYNFRQALLRKRANLVRPPPHGEGSHLVLEFGDAFTMTIYVTPLLVTLRAQAPLPTTKTSTKATTETDENTVDPIGAIVGCATMKPLSYGLAGRGQQCTLTSTRATRGNTSTSDRNAQILQGPPPLRVWGATGTVETIGRAVEERLRDASAHATYILRKCFEGTAKGTASDFEVELLEATALLEFIQLARTTYESDWQDDDV